MPRRRSVAPDDGSPIGSGGARPEPRSASSSSTKPSRRLRSSCRCWRRLIARGAAPPSLAAVSFVCASSTELMPASSIALPRRLTAAWALASATARRSSADCSCAQSADCAAGCSSGAGSAPSSSPLPSSSMPAPAVGGGRGGGLVWPPALQSAQQRQLQRSGLLQTKSASPPPFTTPHTAHGQRALAGGAPILAKAGCATVYRQSAVSHTPQCSTGSAGLTASASASAMIVLTSCS